MTTIITFLFLLTCGLTPWFLFTGLVLKKNSASGSTVHSSVKITTIDLFVRQYFAGKMNRRIVLDSCNGKIVGYCMMSDTGEITFYLEDHQPVFALQKPKSGWFITRTFESGIQHGDIAKKLILHLERNLYN